MHRTDGELQVDPGLPARLMGAVIPLAALMLVLVGASRGGFASTPEDPVPPSLVAAATVLGCVALSYRSLTQRANLGPSTLRCRNVLVGYGVEWERVEALVVIHRPGVHLVEVRVSDLRRRQRIGAATRFDRSSFEEVLEVLRAHPAAAAVLVDDPT